MCFLIASVAAITSSPFVIGVPGISVLESFVVVTVGMGITMVAVSVVISVATETMMASAVVVRKVCGHRHGNKSEKEADNNSAMHLEVWNREVRKMNFRSTD